MEMGRILVLVVKCLLGGGYKFKHSGKTCAFARYVETPGLIAGFLIKKKLQVRRLRTLICSGKCLSWETLPTYGYKEWM